MKFHPTAIPEVVLVEPDVFGDDRGFFLETYHQEKYARRRHARDRSSRTTTPSPCAAPCAACTPSSARPRGS